MSERDEFTAEDAQMLDLLRKAGLRDDPSAVVTRDVQAAVSAVWRAVVAARRRRRTFLAAAAGVTALAVSAALTMRFSLDRPVPLATVQRVNGDVFVASGGNSPWTRVAEGSLIATGDSMRSAAAGALQLDNGLALRIDRDTSLKVVADDRIALSAGAVYVDSKPGADGAMLVIDTNAGSVRHVGTQYQVRILSAGVDVSVREGHVMIETEGVRNLASSGERVQISTRGSVQRSSIAPTDELWRWTSEVAPPFAIENASLAQFLDWSARETGRALVYESVLAQTAAQQEILSGSIEKLTPDQALTAVLASTALRQREAGPAMIHIAFAPVDPVPSARPTR